MLLLSTVVLFAVSQIIGVSLILLTALLYVALFLPGIMHRVSVRTALAAMDNAHNWDVLWRAGGLAITFKGTQVATCVSPSGNWRGFVIQYLPHTEENTEAQGISEETELERQTHQLPASLDFDPDMSALSLSRCASSYGFSYLRHHPSEELGEPCPRNVGLFPKNLHVQMQIVCPQQASGSDGPPYKH